MSSNVIIKYFILISIVYNCASIACATLKFINVVFRHGDRTPVLGFEFYPKDPYKNYTFHPPGSGQLTIDGEMRAYTMGKFLRERYNDFLGEIYTQGSIEARSTDYNRTKETLNQVLKALYPRVEIPTTFVPRSEDSLLLSLFSKEFKDEYSKVLKMPDVKQKWEELEDFNENLSLWTGSKIKKTFDIFKIYSTLEVEKFLNLTLPSWTQSVYPNGTLLDGTVLEFEISNYNQEMKKLSGGILIRKFLKDMESVISGAMDEKRKLMLYSAHDMNIVSVLKTLNVYYPHFPKYSSAVIVELHLVNQDHFVKVLYYKGVPAEFIELRIPGCELLCPIKQFRNLTENVIPSGD